MRKIFCILIMLVMLVSFAALPVAAAETVSLTVSKVTAQPGDEVKVTISVANNTGLASLKFDVAYNSVLTLTNVAFNSAFGSMVTAPEPYKNPEPLTMISPLSDITANGVFVTLTFTVSDNAAYGHKANITISYDANDIYDGEYNNVPVSVSNGSVTIVCPHSDTADVPAKEATCTEAGYTAGTYCNTCKSYISGHKEILATGVHSWNSGSVTEEPSCAQTGVESFSCSVCGGTKTETLDKTTDHKYGNWVKVDATNHSHTCSVCQGTETAAHTWDSGKETKAATCKETGVMTYTCTATGCDAFYTEEIPVSTKHTFGNLVAVDDTNHKDVCSVCQKEITEAHTYDRGKVTKAATCKETGIKTYTCADCDHTKTEEIAKTENHKFSAWTKVDVQNHSRACSVCEKVETAAHGYKSSWSKDKNEHWHACADCGDKIDVTAHTPGAAATEKNPQTCTVCKYVIKPALGHSHKWDDTLTLDETGHYYACAGCEEKKDEAAHDFENACDGQCETCGYTRETAHVFGTEWVSDATGHYHSCSVCDEKADEDVHIPGDAATETTAQTCTICGYEIVAALGHSFSDTWSTDEENHWHVCACGEKEGLEEHTWDEGEEGDDGIVYTCTVCGATRTEPKPFNWLWIVIGAAVVLLIVVIIIVAKKKKK